MTIADYFTEVEDLNLYAELDSETFPGLLKPLLNPELRDLLKVCNNIKPITTYQEWKEKALQMGAELEAEKGNSILPDSSTEDEQERDS